MKTRKFFSYFIIIVSLFLVIFCIFFANKYQAKSAVTPVHSNPQPTVLDGDLLEHLYFYDTVTGVSTYCYYQKSDATWYALMPSYYESKRFKVFCNVIGIDDITIDSTTEENMYSVSFWDDTSSLIESRNLCILKSANIPCIYINTETGSLDTINSDKNIIETVETTIIDTTGKLIYSNDKDCIKGHGNRSWGADKKPYGLKLQEEIPLFNMSAAKDWVLISNVSDLSYIQNAITYEMAHEAGMPYSPDFQYIDLYFNGVYHGNYMLVEKLAIDENHIDIVDLASQNENLNLSLSQGEAKTFYEDNMKGYTLNTNPVDITGGYLIERDYSGKYNDEICGFETNLLREKYVVKSPNNASREEIIYISGLINNFEHALLSDSDEWLEYIDLTSWADKYIVEEFTQNRGAGTTSAFYYKPQDTVSTKVFAGPVWDYDTAYSGSTRQLAFSGLHMLAPTNVYYYLYQKPVFQAEVKKEYQRFFSDYLSSMPERVEYYAELIDSSVKMDQIRWNTDAFRHHLDNNIEYIVERKDFLDEVWINNAELCNIHLIDPVFNIKWNYAVIRGEHLSSPNQHFRSWINVSDGSFHTENTKINKSMTFVGSSLTTRYGYIE